MYTKRIGGIKSQPTDEVISQPYSQSTQPSLTERFVSSIPEVFKSVASNAYDLFKQKLKESRERSYTENISEANRQAVGLVKGAGNFLYSIPKYAARAGITGAQSIAQGLGASQLGQTVNPKEFGIEKIIGEEPIMSIQDKIKTARDTINQYGGTQFEQKTYPVIFAIGGTALDAWIGGSGKNAARPIIKNIENRLGRAIEKETAERITKEVAEKTAVKSFSLLKTSEQQAELAKIYVKNLGEQIDKEVIRRTGKETPVAIKSAIADNLKQISLLNNKTDEKEAVNLLIDDIVDSYSKKESAVKLATKATGKTKPSEVKSIVRKTTGQVKPSQIFQTTEEKAFREKMRTAQIYSKIGAKAGKTSMVELQRSARKYISDLPPKTQQKILSQVSFSEVKTKNQLKNVLDKIDTARTTYKNESERRTIVKEILPEINSIKERGLANQFRVAAKEEGVSRINSINEIKNLSSEELGKLKSAINKVKDKTKPVIAEDVNWSKIKAPSDKPVKTRTQKIKGAFEGSIGTFSTSLRRTGEAGERLLQSYKLGVRGAEYAKGKAIVNIGKMTKGFIRKYDKLSTSRFLKSKVNDAKEMAYRLWNQDINGAVKIADKRGFGKELKEVSKYLEDVRDRAQKAGIKVGKIEGYFPRIVRDKEGLFRQIAKDTGKDFDVIKKEISNAMKSKLGIVDPEEETKIIENILLGYRGGISKGTSTMKSRTLKDLPPEYMQYYYTPNKTLEIYSSNMENRIVLAQRLGSDKKAKMAMADNIADKMSILADDNRIGKLVTKYGVKSLDDLDKLKRLTEAYYRNDKSKKSEIMSVLDDAATLMLMGSPTSTIVQIGDIIPSLMVSFPKTMKAFLTVPFKKRVDTTKLFPNLSAELNTQKGLSKAIDKVFTATGLKTVTEHMANVLGETIRLDFKSKAKSPDKRFLKHLAIVFDDNLKTINRVISDLKSNNMTNEVEYLIANEINEWTPRYLTEMPENWIKHPNARFLWKLQSWNIKNIDVYRNQIIKKIKDGSVSEKAKGLKDFMKFTSLLVAAGMTTDEVKSWITGKERPQDESFSDRIVSGLMNIAMVSKFDAYNMEKGVGSWIGSRIPIVSIAETFRKDLTEKDPRKKLESTKYIPLMGQIYYNVAGRGLQKQEERPDILYKNLAKMSGEQQKAELKKLKEEKPSKYNNLIKYTKDKEWGITEKEKEFRNMGVETGERASALIKYIRNQKDPNYTYKKLKAVGIISDNVNDQIKEIIKQ